MLAGPARHGLAGLGALAAGALGRRADRLDRDPALVEQDRAGRGQRDPAACPLQERHAKLALQLADGRRERRLGHPQPHLGPGEVQLLGDRDEVAELAQLEVIHTRSVWIRRQRVLLSRSARGCTGGHGHHGTAERVRGLGRRAYTIRAELAEPAAAGAVVDAVADEFGRLDILVSNAGITHWGSVAQTAVEDFDRLVAVNARAPFLLMQAAASRLADGGRVVTISSGVTSTALAGIGLYSGGEGLPGPGHEGGRGGVRTARDHGQRGGAGEHRDGTVRDPDGAAEGGGGSIVRSRADREPADTAAVVAFLASDEAGFITGQVIYAVGGQHGPVRWSG